MIFKLLELFLCKPKRTIFFHEKHTSTSSSKKQNTVIEELCHRFSITDIRKSTNNFDESRLVGRGGFRRFYKCCLEYNIAATDRTVPVKKTVTVVKQMFYPCDFDEWENFTNEIEVLCQLNHPNVVSLIGFCEHKYEKILVYEYLSNGSLDDYLFDGVVKGLSWKKRLEICIGIARGLHYLHSGLKRTIIHRDINPSNILLDSNLVPKLTNFGLSLRGQRFTSKPKQIQGIITTGTGCYMPLEYVKYGIFTDKFDVYAFGVILLQVVCAKKPNKIIADTPIEKKIDPVLEGKIAPECWKIYLNTVERCLKDDLNERPTMGEVEVELEQALRLQEQADIIGDNNAYYSLLSNNIIDLWMHRWLGLATSLM